MTTYTIEDNEIAIGGQTIDFNGSIFDAIELDSIVVIRLEANPDQYPSGDIYKYRNVVGINNDGSISWKIPARPKSEHRQYGGISIQNDGDLWAHNTCGMSYQIDPESGKILDQLFTK